MEYRNLTNQEIETLQRNRCRAQNWQTVSVAGEGFIAERCYDTSFYGECRLGRNDGTVLCDLGIELPAGIRHSRVIESAVGDNTLLENVAVVARCDIGSRCLISGANAIITTEATTFGQGNAISVLNEAGEGNVVLYAGLTSQIAAITALPLHLGERYDAADDTTEQRRQAKEAIRRMVMEEVKRTVPERTSIGAGVRIQGVGEIINAWIGDDTEVRGALRISESTLTGEQGNAVFVGAGVICDGCVVTSGSVLSNNVIAKNSFVGENSTLTEGFSATDSLFFANSFMANGEACAAFCGPFTVSHHKASLLIGGMYSFYNAGSATNFSNHAYKMGPLHYGILDRGSKTASGAHILMPAHIGAFSMCMGKIATHPDTTRLPFSYVIGDGTDTYIVPGRNIATAGTYRDVGKWAKRDMRPENARHSIIDYQWLNPSTMRHVVEAKMLLEDVLDKQSGADVYELPDGALIRPSSLRKGISLYTMAIKMYLAEYLDIADTVSDDILRAADADNFIDLSGMLVSNRDIIKLVNDVMSGDIDTVSGLQERLDILAADTTARHAAYKRLAISIADAIYGWGSLDDDDRLQLLDSCKEAHAQWLTHIKRDAEREYELGDVDFDVLSAFVAKLK